MAGRPKGTPKTGGRKPGGRNKVVKDIKVLAQGYGEEALMFLVSTVRDSEAPHAARVSAAKEVIDRGYGKAVQMTDLTSSDGTMTPKGLAEFYGDGCS